MKIRHLFSGVDVGPLLWALQSNPQLWNEHRSRTQSEDSPHREVDDIWARYTADGKITHGEHESVWYPAADVLPLKEITEALMYCVGGESIGGVLITRIRAGKQCYPHIDGGWHASYHEKFAVQVQSHPGQMFCFDGESLESKPGDVFTFDNSFSHWVTNDTPSDRITLIYSIKTSGAPCLSQQ